MVGADGKIAPSWPESRWFDMSCQNSHLAYSKGKMHMVLPNPCKSLVNWGLPLQMERAPIKPKPF